MNCPNCGLVIQGNPKFCPNCGTPIAPISVEPQPNPVPEPKPEPVPEPEPVPQPKPQPTPQPTQPTPQPAPQPTPQPVENEIKPTTMEKTLALEAYLGILVLAPIFGAKQSTFVRFHANQGLILCIISFALSLLMTFNSVIIAAVDALWLSIILGLINGLYGLVSCGVIALAVIGIINALKGKMKKLPIIGNIKILK